ncbi:amino acid adenylation domain-containing protein [Streptomyces sp. NPDC050560]|uniref:amino acid adenylation domain-containing protein n=1 Tax=Streptomyces sp. NPDC050560 TaxID=3365630 RepID=UPI0037B15191
MPTPEPTGPGHALLAAQEGIWTGQQLDPGGPAYNTGEYVDIEGPVDTAAFESALRRSVVETEAVNAVFAVADDGRPRQVDAPADGWPLHVKDLTAAPDPRGAALDWMAGDLATPVDLAHGPLFAHALLRLAPDRYLWWHRVHHIALDGFGLSLVARRVADLYTALLAGSPPAESGFGSLAAVRAEEAAYRASPRFGRDRDFWTRRFADRPAVPTPARRVALPARTFRRLVTDVEPERADALRSTARSLGVTWPELLLAVVAAHLGQVTGAPEPVLSFPVMARFGSASLRVPSTVRNVLPLRLPVGPDDTARTLATRAAAELRAVLPHQRYRYEELRRDLRLVGGERRLSGPGVNIMPFAYDLRFAGHRSTVHNVSAGPVDDLSVNVYDRAEGGGLRMALDAHPDLYDAGALATHRQALLALLEQAVSAPDRPLVQGRASRPRAAVRVLDGGPLPTPAKPVLDLIAEHAARQPETTAVEQGGRRLSYAALHTAAGALATRVAASGAGRGDLVAVALPRGTDAVVATLGVLMSGAVLCPVDLTGPRARARSILDATQPRLVLAASADANSLGPHPVLLTDGPAEAVGAETPAPHAPAPGDPAYVIHTSGTTGLPKGVETGHHALARFVAGAGHRYGPGRDDRVLQFAPPHFDTYVEEVFLTLCAGATLVVRTDDMTDSVPGFLTACARLGVTFLDLPTAYWHEVAHTLSTGAAALPAAVHTVVVGGEAALAERVDRWRTTVGSGVRLVNTYGPTEATVVATAADLNDPSLGPGDVPIGVPLPGVGAAVVDGELYLLGENLANGYLGSPPDAARFAPLGVLPGAPRAYRTGDLVRLGEDGQLRYRGRADMEIKVSGHRVHPAEVESALLTHPQVGEAAVIGRRLDDGTQALTAFLVPEGPPPRAVDIRSHLASRLPAALVPAAVICLDRLPMTSTGKTDREALAVLATGRAPTEPSAPRGTGAVVTDAWRRALGLSDLSPNDDVFDAGAHSLQAIQVANRLGAKLGREVRVAWLFEHPTPASLAGFLDLRRAPERGPAGGPPAAVLTDAVLDPAVRPADCARKPGPPSRVLLTGATGFVGAHLLAELLTGTGAHVVCPVRAADDVAARERLSRALESHLIRLPADAFARVTAVGADLARPALDEPLRAELAAGCDTVIHNAASVSVLRDYTSLSAANTRATALLLRETAGRSVPLHYVSTLSVAPPLALAAEVPETFFPAHTGLRYGYQQSKWASERLLEQASQRGLPVTVHRLGRVVGPPATGSLNERDFLWGVLRAGVPAGLVPALFEEETWIAADHAAASLVRICLGPALPKETVFHHVGSRVRLDDVYAWVGEYGYPLRRVPLEEWRARLADSEAAAPSLAFFGASAFADGDLSLGPVRTDHTARALDGTGVTAAPVGRDLVFRGLDHCVARGLLPAPAAERRRAAGD